MSHDNSLLAESQRITGETNSLAGHSILGIFGADDAINYLKTIRKVIDTGEPQVIDATMNWQGTLVPIRSRIFKLSDTTAESYNLTVGPVITANQKTDHK